MYIWEVYQWCICGRYFWRCICGNYFWGVHFCDVYARHISVRVYMESISGSVEVISGIYRCEIFLGCIYGMYFCDVYVGRISGSVYVEGISVLCMW